jgi:hypothetical protein
MRKLIPFALLVVVFAATACKEESTPDKAGGAAGAGTPPAPEPAKK